MTISLRKISSSIWASWLLSNHINLNTPIPMTSPLWLCTNQRESHMWLYPLFHPANKLCPPSARNAVPILPRKKQRYKTLLLHKDSLNSFPTYFYHSKLPNIIYLVLIICRYQFCFALSMYSVRTGTKVFLSFVSSYLDLIWCSPYNRCYTHRTYECYQFLYIMSRELLDI